jgi:ribosomal protein S18 acetylase RimI-like enzyme
MSELCLIDIPWETRNLGMPAYQLEGTIKNHKAVESILEKKQTQLNENFFVQLKVDTQNINQAIFSQEAGFRLIEMSICPFLDVNLISSKVARDGIKSIYSIKPEKNLAIKNYCSPVERLESSMKSQMLEISKETFSTDRFHMDPSCEKFVADHRIALWVELDLLKNYQNYCTYLMQNETLIGFNVWNKESMILAGISQDFTGRGLGKSLYVQTILDGMSKGLKEVSSSISLNNIPVLNLYTKLGFSYRKPKYILHYWS